MAFLTDDARATGVSIAWTIIIATYMPAVFYLWATPWLRARVLNRVRMWLSREWRLIPFYLAAILVSLAALRYILRDQ